MANFQIAVQNEKIKNKAERLINDLMEKNDLKNQQEALERLVELAQAGRENVELTEGGVDCRALDVSYGAIRAQFVSVVKACEEKTRASEEKANKLKETYEKKLCSANDENKELKDKLDNDKKEIAELTKSNEQAKDTNKVLQGQIDILKQQLEEQTKSHKAEIERITATQQWASLSDEIVKFLQAQQKKK